MKYAWKGYDGTNKIFNLAYEMPSWKVHRALIKAKLEPYLGFLHSIQHGKPSLVCDFMELYRYIIDDFLIEYCRQLRSKDFIKKAENIGRKKHGKREYLQNLLTQKMMKKMDVFFNSSLDIPRIRYGKQQSFETLINEECLSFARYLRAEKDTWLPRREKNSC